MKRLRKFALTVVLIIIVGLGVVFIANSSQAATSQDVSVNATPAFMSISNAPSSYDFGVISENSSENTTNGYFTITNSSTVNIDLNIQCNGWSSTGSAWTYNDPASDTANLDASSGDGGVGGSTGAGAWDISILNGSNTLICDNVTTATNPTWEIQLDTPTEFTHGDEQTTTVTIAAIAE